MTASWKVSEMIHLLHYLQSIQRVKSGTIKTDQFHIHKLSLGNNLVRDIRASGTANEIAEGINSPCHIIIQAAYL